MMISNNDKKYWLEHWMQVKIRKPTKRMTDGRLILRVRKRSKGAFG